MLEVLESIGLVTIQDLGRPGYGHLGVPPSGALDPETALLRSMSSPGLGLSQPGFLNFKGALNGAEG